MNNIIFLLYLANNEIWKKIQDGNYLLKFPKKMVFSWAHCETDFLWRYQLWMRFPWSCLGFSWPQTRARTKQDSDCLSHFLEVLTVLEEERKTLKPYCMPLLLILSLTRMHCCVYYNFFWLFTVNILFLYFIFQEFLK